MGFFHRSNPIDSLKSVLREKGTLFIFRDIPLSLHKVFEKMTVLSPVIFAMSSRFYAEFKKLYEK